MWRALALLGLCIWIATIVSSGAVNYLAAYELGRSPIEAQLFAVVGVCADAWKAIGPVLNAALWRSRRPAATAAGSVVWIVCFIFAMTAALGFVARNREAVVRGREAARLLHGNVSAELAKARRQRDFLGDPGFAAELETAIAAELAKPVPGGSVGALSEQCSKDYARTRSACAEVALLRVRLAKALEAARLDAVIRDRERDLVALERDGATRAVDPQASLISRLSLGWIAVADVGLMLTLLLVAMVELISAFAPLVVHEFVRVSRMTPPVAAGRDRPQHGAAEPDEPRHEPMRAASTPQPEGAPANVYEYLTTRTRPCLDGATSADALADDYEAWCRENRARPLSRFGFLRQLDAIVARDLAGRVVGESGVYRGMCLACTRTGNSRAVADLCST